MTREKYESLPLATLRELAKARKMKGISTLKKGDLIEAMLAQDDNRVTTEVDRLEELIESSSSEITNDLNVEIQARKDGDN